jgi:hypothetical protein
VHRCEVEHRKALTLARQAEEPELEAWTLTGMARASFAAGHLQSALTHVLD